MNDYSTQDSELESGTNEIEELILNNQKLITDNENLNKKLRELEHNFTQTNSQSAMEIEKLKRSNNNLEELLKSIKCEPKLDKNGDNPDAKSADELELIVTDLENQVFLLETSEQNLKRQIQALNIENSNFKLEIGKLTISSSNRENNFPKPSSDELNVDNLDEETRLLLTELMTEVEELKKEKNEISEKALNMITEKEIENGYR